MHVKSSQGKGSTFGFTSLHDVPTKQELLAFLRSSDKQNEALVVPEHKSASMTSTPTMQAPKFGMLCVAEDNP